MSDTEKRAAVLERFYAKHHGKLEPLLIVDDWVMDDMADRIVELEAAIERVLALHEPIAKDIPKCVTCKDYAGYHVDLPCPTLCALEGTP